MTQSYLEWIRQAPTREQRVREIARGWALVLTAAGDTDVKAVAATYRELLHLRVPEVEDAEITEGMWRIAQAMAEAAR